METRIALIGIIVEKYESAEKINDILHDFGEYIIGRMGIPYRSRNINIISVVLDAPNNVISSVAGKLGKLEGVNVKTIYDREQSRRQELI